MQLTTFALEKLGYVRLDAGRTISGRFRRIEVYEVRGFDIDDTAQMQFQETINSVPVNIAVGNQVNALAQMLLSQDFTGDEQVWQKERRVSPPYKMIVFGPTDEHQSSGAHYKESADEVTTYESFATAKSELKAQSEAVSPALLTALRMTFSSAQKPVRFRHVDSAFFGMTPEGKLIKDLRFEMRADAYASTKLDREVFNRKMMRSIEMAKAFDPKVAQFHMLGAEENDPLKRFLFLFLFVERLIHSTYAQIDHQSAVSGTLSRHSRLSEAGAKLLGDHRNSWKDLRNRLVWCAMHFWTHLDDADIAQFERVKGVRDKLAHGKIIVPTEDAVLEIEQLALRLNGA